MTHSEFDRRVARDREAVESRLDAILAAAGSRHDRVGEAVRYALLGGGKRLRPLLCLWTHDVFAPVHIAATRAAALEAGCAVECVHSYSLVHDDLPCMDDDDLRRGRPSVHRRYDEATAVLVGDALLTLAFEVLAGLPARGVPPAAALDAIATLASAAGTAGLVAGQALDLETTGPPATTAPPDAASVRARVEQIHELKTARLFAAAMELGAHLALGAHEAAGDARARVRQAGLLAGSAFQIVDDLLDLEGDAKTLGKTPRKDVNRGKLTFPAAAGVPAARRVARERIARALACLPEAAGTPLAELLSWVVERRA